MTFTLASLVTVAASGQRPQPVDTAHLQRILVAEDARGTGTDGVTPLLEGLESRDSLLRRVAVRGIGRLQRPDLARQLAPRLTDPVAAVRAEAGNAIAQSVSRVTRRASDTSQANVRWAAGVLVGALDAERDSAVADALAEAIGRLPFGDPQPVRDSGFAVRAQAVIVAHGGSGFGAIHGLYVISINRGTTGGLSAAGLALMQRAARSSPDPRIRRVAVLALAPTTFIDSVTVLAASRDPDEQVRRLALGGVRALSPTARAGVERAALADPSPIVRIAAIGAVRAPHPGVPVPDCSPIIAATSDPHPYVAQTAIDALGVPCADSTAAVKALNLVLDESTPNHRSWPARNHALVALAKLGHTGSLRLLARSRVAEAQIGVAQAAAAAGDTAILLGLAGSADHNVREAAVTGLAKWMKHAADTIYMAALASPGYQVILAAANALAGTKHPGALPALLDNFDRVSRERRENSRDPRAAMLKRIGELGSSANGTRITPYLADFDTTIATSVASTLSKWTGTTVTARPRPLPIRAEPLAQPLLARDVRLRVTMAASSGGGTFVVQLFTDEAPATVARILRLAHEHYYDGHVFQRVEPNFVVQGGGPDASEYVGDAAFMRDELTTRSHLRGTLGISSRGRDTGDAQWFFNLVDNTRLDHEYTVFGEIVSGRDVAERIMEGDVIGRVTIDDRR